MEDIVADPEKVNKLARQNERENLRFRRYLKDQPSEKIDEIVHRLNQNISDKIDCTSCANCCKQRQPVLYERDIERFSEGLEIDKSKFANEFLIETTLNTDTYEFDTDDDPCLYLEDNLCTNYEHRPDDCRSFPHLNKNDITSRTIALFHNTFICPIVYNVVEALKEELNYESL